MYSRILPFFSGGISLIHFHIHSLAMTLSLTCSIARPVSRLLRARSKSTSLVCSKLPGRPCVYDMYIYIYMTYITDWQIVDYIYNYIYIHNSWLNIHGSHPCLCHVKFTFDLHCSIYDFTVPIAQERIRSRGAGVADWRPKVTGLEG